MVQRCAEILMNMGVVVPEKKHDRMIAWYFGQLLILDQLLLLLQLYVLSEYKVPADEQLQFCVFHSLRLTLVWKVLARRCPNKQYSPRFLFGEGSGNDDPDLFLIGNDSPTKYKYKDKHYNRQDDPNNKLDWCFCSLGVLNSGQESEKKCWP